MLMFMFSRSSWIHLRIPFSYFLMPVFWFSLAISPNFGEKPLLWTLIIVHLFLYPASNGYNSYFDKDEKSIGGVKNPPPVNKGLYYLALVFDAAAVILGYVMINATFAILLLVYGLVSKAYSHPAIRLKKYAIGGWFITGLFQGLFTFVMCYVGINRFELDHVWRASVLIPGLLSSLVLWASYPMTQVYQHEEDARRGDRTLSLMLGIRGTFYFTGSVFALVSAGFVAYFYYLLGAQYILPFLLAMSPVVLYFLWWMIQVLRDERQADYTHTMRLNFISATALNGFFIYLFLQVSQLLQYLQ